MRAGAFGRFLRAGQGWLIAAAAVLYGSVGWAGRLGGRDQHATVADPDGYTPGGDDWATDNPATHVPGTDEWFPADWPIDDAPRNPVGAARRCLPQPSEPRLPWWRRAFRWCR